MKIVCVCGTRPELIKMAPIIEAFLEMGEVELKFVWSSQHYDYNMSRVFFEELRLPEPDVNLNVRSGSHAKQTARIMLGLDRVFKEDRPDIVMAQGDTNTVLASGLTAIKEHIPFGHVEAGLRSYDRVMPEEINRCVAGVCAELSFAPTPISAINLVYEGIPPGRIYITGNTIVDVVRKVTRKAARKEIADKFNIDPTVKNVLLTLHRAETVDDPGRLREIVEALKRLNHDAKIVFPAHPRTLKRFKEFGLIDKIKSCPNLLLVAPMGYIEFLNLLSMMDLVLTDSGGVQEEALIMHVPTVTLRYSTERPETVWSGWNVLAGVERKRIVKKAQDILNGSPSARTRHWARLNLDGLYQWAGSDTKEIFADSPLGDGKAGRRIAKIVVDRLGKGLSIEQAKYLSAGSAIHRLLKVSDTVTVSKFTRSPDVLVTAIYTKSGKPLFPYPDQLLKPGYHVRVFGEATSIAALNSALS